MNTKSVLIATLFAAAAGSAFAADYVATAGNPEMQIAQSATARPEARVVTRSGTAVTANAASKDETYALPANHADSRTRAQARAQAAAYNMSAEARNAARLDLGGQQ